MTSTTTDYLEIARALAARPNDWPFAPRFDPSQRWYRRLAAADHDADTEAWLLTWLPGQGTDLHDHGGSAGAFVVITGTLTERVATTATPTDAASAYPAIGCATGTAVGEATVALASRRFAAGEGHRFGPHYVHEVLNASDRPAISLHVYGPALRTMTRYRLHDGDLRVTATESAGVTW